MPLVLGGWLFGIGWGVAGLCPGPAVVAATFGLPGPALAFMPALVLGMKVCQRLFFFFFFRPASVLCPHAPGCRAFLATCQRYCFVCLRRGRRLLWLSGCSMPMIARRGRSRCVWFVRCVVACDFRDADASEFCCCRQSSLVACSCHPRRFRCGHNCFARFSQPCCTAKLAFVPRDIESALKHCGTARFCLNAHQRRKAHDASFLFVLLRLLGRPRPPCPFLTPAG